MPESESDADHFPLCDPWQAARRGQQLSGSIRLAALERLCDALTDDAGTMPWSARFSVQPAPGGEQHFRVDIEAGGDLSLPCSRCAEPVVVPVSVARRLRLVADEQLAASLDEVAEDHDVIAAERSFDVLALVEDELIMALPTWPEHAVCPVAPGTMPPRRKAAHGLAGGSGSADDGMGGDAGSEAGEAAGTDAATDTGADPHADTDRQFPFADLASQWRKK